MKMKKKYMFAATALVTVVMAATAANASVLSLRTGVFQAGKTRVTNCTASATLTYRNNVAAENFALEGVDISSNAACAGKFVNLAHTTRLNAGATMQAGAFGVLLDASGNACVRVNSIDASLWGSPTASNPSHTQNDIVFLIKDTADATPAFFSGWFVTGACA